MGKRALWTGVLAVGLVAPWAEIPRTTIPTPLPTVPGAKAHGVASSIAKAGVATDPPLAATTVTVPVNISPLTTAAIVMPSFSPAPVKSADPVIKRVTALSLNPYPTPRTPADTLADGTPTDSPEADSHPFSEPLMLSMAPSDDDSVFSLPTPVQPGQGTNMGGVNISLTTAYLNHYVYRGVDHSITSPRAPGQQASTKAKSLNLETNGKLEFDLGNFPHPFVGLFANIYDRDPKSRFQEIRPYYGAEWTVRPFTIEGGGITYIYPEREKLNTAEVYGKFSLNDSFLFNTEKPIFSPYFYGAYDYDKNNGWYFEAGITHDFVLEDIGLTLTFQGDAAYIMGFQQQFVFIDPSHDTGFQHYDLGMVARYSLNHLLNFSDRYGEFDVVGTLFYTGKLEKDIRADNVLWGGAGIGFKY